MERAEADEVLTAALERDALTDQLDDVGGLEDQRLAIATAIERHYASLLLDLRPKEIVPEPTGLSPTALILVPSPGATDVYYFT